MRTAPRDDDVTSRGLSPEHVCEDGWLGYDEHGRIRPCLICRPHLRQRMRAGVRAAMKKSADAGTEGGRHE